MFIERLTNLVTKVELLEKHQLLKLDEVLTHVRPKKHDNKVQWLKHWFVKNFTERIIILILIALMGYLGIVNVNEIISKHLGKITNQEVKTNEK